MDRDKLDKGFSAFLVNYRKAEKLLGSEFYPILLPPMSNPYSTYIKKEVLSGWRRRCKCIVIREGHVWADKYTYV